jgi:formate dehydrogenase (hydrogenase)
MTTRRRNDVPRLTTPLVRDNGVLRVATWEHALERASAGLRSAIDSGGPNSVGFFSCSKATNEVNFVAQKVMRVAVGSNNIDSCNRT